MKHPIDTIRELPMMDRRVLTLTDRKTGVSRSFSISLRAWNSFTLESADITEIYVNENQVALCHIGRNVGKYIERFRAAFTEPYLGKEIQ